MKNSHIRLAAIFLSLTLLLSACFFNDKETKVDKEVVVDAENKEEKPKTAGDPTVESKDNNTETNTSEQKAPVKDPEDSEINETQENVVNQEEPKVVEQEKPMTEETKKPENQEKKPITGTNKPKTTPEETKASENKTNTSTEQKASSTTNKSIDDLKADQMISISKNVSIYANADDAKNQTNKLKEYQAGNYYIYKIFNNIINISKSKGVAGGWINPSDIDIKVSSNQTNTSETQVKTGDSEPKTNTSTSDAKYSWSWKYPAGAGKLLSSYGGLYRLSNNNIYMTFDNGYEYKNLTGKILDTLQANNVKAVFFVTSDYLRSKPNFVKRMINEGHIVGNHTAYHRNHNVVSKEKIFEDLNQWEKDYVKLIGYKPTVKLYRPPEGKFNETSIQLARDLGYKTILWGYAYGDWDTANQPNEQEALNKLLTNNRAGNILLLHAISQTNTNILADYIQQTRAQGYNFALLK